MPTIFDADRKSLGEIAARRRASWRQKVRDGTITPPELSGGTFTVSNLGMFGVTNFSAVINPPQAALLAVGALRAEGRSSTATRAASSPRDMMGVTLACDHRILYGADGAQFLGARARPARAAAGAGALELTADFRLAQRAIPSSGSPAASIVAEPQGIDVCRVEQPHAAGGTPAALHGACSAAGSRRAHRVRRRRSPRTRSSTTGSTRWCWRLRPDLLCARHGRARGERGGLDPDRDRASRPGPSATPTGPSTCPTSEEIAYPSLADAARLMLFPAAVRGDRVARAGARAALPREPLARRSDRRAGDRRGRRRDPVPGHRARPRSGDVEARG